MAGGRIDRTLRGAAAIVGVADDVSPTGELTRTGRELEVAMILAALEDAGLSLERRRRRLPCRVVHGAGRVPQHPPDLYRLHHDGWLQLRGPPRARGGRHRRRPVRGRGQRLRRHATQRSDPEASGRAPQSLGGPNPMLEWEFPYALRMPMGPYALAASRHMHEFGTTSEQLAQIAVSTREWASLNPRARYQSPLTIDEVLSSPMQTSPLHLLDCCLVTDGAGAFVMTSAEKARSLRKPPIFVLGAATCHDHLMITQMPDLTTTPGAVSGPRAFAQAGITPADVDVLMGYDSFTITALLHLEDLGFCAKGEGGPFAADGKLGPGGSLPMNTNGGGLSYTHPGMYGMFLIVEAVRQLRGEAEARQVPGAEVAVAHGSGMVLSCMSTAVLGTEAAL